MRLSIRNKIGILINAIFIFVMLLAFGLTWVNIISIDQNYVIFFGDLGAYLTVTAIRDSNPNSILKKHQILSTAILVTSIAILVFILLISPLKSYISEITAEIFAIVFWVSTKTIDWNAKRKHKQITNEIAKS